MNYPIPADALDDRHAWVGTASAHPFRDALIRDRARLIEPSKVDCAYAAGFFDGEGNINIAKSNRADCSGPVYTLNIGASQNAAEPLLFIQNRWGGSIYAKAPKPPRKGHYVWGCHANVGAIFLLEILPHLTVKRERALHALQFQAIKAGQGHHGDQVARRAEFEAFYQRMPALNAYGPRFTNTSGAS